MTSIAARKAEIDTALGVAEMKLTRLNLCSTCSDRNVNFLLDRTKAESPLKISLSHCKALTCLRFAGLVADSRALTHKLYCMARDL